MQRGVSKEVVRKKGVNTIYIYLNEEMLDLKQQPISAIHAELLGRGGLFPFSDSEFGEVVTHALPQQASIFFNERFIGKAGPVYVWMVGQYSMVAKTEGQTMCENDVAVTKGEKVMLTCSN